MQNRLIAIGVLVVGVSALGAGIWVVRGSGGEAVASDATRMDRIEPPAQRLVAQAPPIEIPESEEVAMDPDRIRTNGRGGRNGRGEGRDMFGRMEEMIKKYDLDGDGVLSSEERKAMMLAIAEEQRERMDLDGDGEISLDERVAARRERMLNSDWGKRIADRFDADGDGVLSIEEEANMDAMLREREQQRIDRDLERYDTDGDGTISSEERAVQQEQRQARQDERMREVTEQFDEDGDGNLDEDERVTAYSSYRDRMEIRRFLDRYDTNNDREIGSTESETFLSSYSNKEPYADVNRDGEIDATDIMAFRDYVERAQAAAP